jgi:glycosyltransferase involved in cell wall biosynthesis
VTFHGFVGEDEKVEWLRRATVVVQPSRKEGWGLTVLEANACGAPVVAADVPGLRDSVRDGETGLLVRSRDPGALALALARVLGDPGLRDRLARGALAWAARFGWDEVAAELASVLRAVAARAEIPATRDFLAPAGVAQRLPVRA